MTYYHVPKDCIYSVLEKQNDPFHEKRALSENRRARNIMIIVRTFAHSHFGLHGPLTKSLLILLYEPRGEMFKFRLHGLFNNFSVLSSRFPKKNNWKGLQPLTHISLASHKMAIGKQGRPRSDAAECGVWSGSTLCALSSYISTKHDHNKN